MSDFLDSLDIDIKSETRKRLMELESIGGSHNEELLSLEQRKDRVDLLLDIVIGNLGIQLTSDLRDDILNDIKIKKRPTLWNLRPNKKDIFVSIAGGYLLVTGRILLGLGLLFLYIMVRAVYTLSPGSDPLTKTVEIPYYLKEKHEFDATMLHELTHRVDYENFYALERIASSISRKKRRRNEGLAVASCSDGLEKLYLRTGDLGYRTRRLKEEIFRLSIREKPYWGASKLPILREWFGRNHAEGFAKVIELREKGATLADIYRGKYNQEFS